MSTYDQLPPGKPLLALAHPGHELRVHHWLELAGPDVLVLTDGSGRNGRSQLGRTAEVLQRAGARATEFFGPLADRRLYDAVLGGNVALLAELTRLMARQIVAGRYDYVLGDAAENVILGHDVFRTMLDAALELARRRTDRAILNLDFPLEEAPHAVHPLLRSRTYVLDLDEPALQRKITAARAYVELAGEIDAVVRKLGPRGLAVECLRPAATEAGLAEIHAQPIYETHGEQVAATGGYEHVVRYATHVRPFIDKLHSELGLAEIRGASCAA